MRLPDRSHPFLKSKLWTRRIKVNRRNFIQKASTGLALSSLMASSVFMAGCNLFDQITAWVGVGINSFASIVALLEGNGIVSTAAGTAINLILSIVKSLFADVQAAIANYENADPAQKTTLAGKVSVALQAISNELQKFWSDLTIPDAKLASLVQGLIGIIISTIGGFMLKLPAPPPAKTFARMVSVTPKSRNVHQFVNDFNGLLAQHGESQYAIK